MRPLPFEKRALLRGALRSYGNLAAKSPEDAIALAHSLDQAARGGLRGALAGGIGGYAIAPEGEEGDMALRGAILTGTANALRHGYRGGESMHRYAKNLESMAPGRERRELRRRLQQLREGGAALSDALSD